MTYGFLGRVGWRRRGPSNGMPCRIQNEHWHDDEFKVSGGCRTLPANRNARFPFQRSIQTSLQVGHFSSVPKHQSQVCFASMFSGQYKITNSYVFRPQVIACLSEMIRNDSVAQSLGSRSGNNVGSQHRVSQPCRQQIRSQLLQQHEDVQLNPNVRKPCAADEKRFCAQIKPGQGRILECLKSHRKQLDDACHAAIFQAEREEMDDSGVDYQLVQLCKDPIRRLCQNDVGKALECLKVIRNSLVNYSLHYSTFCKSFQSHLDDNNLETHCKEVVLERMAEQNLDIRFNPALKKACSLDIPKYCLAVCFKGPFPCVKHSFILFFERIIRFGKMRPRIVSSKGKL